MRTWLGLPFDGPGMLLLFTALLLLLGRDAIGLMLPQYSMISSGRYTCENLRGLTPAQTRLCLSNSDHMLSVALGAELGIVQCEHQFRRERWNCSGLHGVNDSSVFQAVIAKGTPEAAFLYAVSSAGVAHAVASGCMDGSISGCRCHSSKPKDFNKDFIWEGCSKNLAYGNEFAKTFVDIRETERNHPRRSTGLKRMLMNLHNNRAGREALSQLHYTKCRCHGVSGSCSIQSCFHTLPGFERVGAYLKKQHAHARQVRFNRAGTKLVALERRERRRVDRAALVYVDPAPQYCVSSSEFGTPGTRQRQCDTEPSEERGTCDTLCCGRGHVTRRIRKSEPCRCRFIWCCEVKCDTCEVERDVHTCR